MREDNVYVNDGSFYAGQVSDEQQEELNKELREVLTSAPVIQQSVERLEYMAGFYESINAIPEAVLNNPEEFMHKVAGNKEAAKVIRDEAAYLKNLLETYVAQ